MYNVLAFIFREYTCRWQTASIKEKVSSCQRAANVRDFHRVRNGASLFLMPSGYTPAWRSCSDASSGSWTGGTCWPRRRSRRTWSCCWLHNLHNWWERSGSKSEKPCPNIYCGEKRTDWTAHCLEAFIKKRELREIIKKSSSPFWKYLEAVGILATQRAAAPGRRSDLKVRRCGFHFCHLQDKRRQKPSVRWPGCISYHFSMVQYLFKQGPIRN